MGIYINQNPVAGKVLVHCFSGRSWSATIVTAYLMLKRGYTAHEAVKILKLKRIQPNSGFLQQMCDLQNTQNRLNDIQLCFSIFTYRY